VDPRSCNTSIKQLSLSADERKENTYNDLHLNMARARSEFQTWFAICVPNRSKAVHSNHKRKTVAESGVAWFNVGTASERRGHNLKR